MMPAKQWLFGFLLIMVTHAYAKKPDIIEQEIHNKLFDPSATDKAKPMVRIIVTKQQPVLTVKGHEPAKKKQVQRRLSKSGLEKIRSARGSGIFHNVSTVGRAGREGRALPRKIDLKKIQALYPFVEGEGRPEEDLPPQENEETSSK